MFDCTTPEDFAVCVSTAAPGELIAYSGNDERGKAVDANTRGLKDAANLVASLGLGTLHLCRDQADRLRYVVLRGEGLTRPQEIVSEILRRRALKGE